MTISSITDFNSPARRHSDSHARDIEHASRNVAQAEGPTSPLWQELQRIDSHRRQGRVIQITMLYKVHGHRFHQIEWVEKESPYADATGYLFPEHKPNVDTKSLNRLAWTALFTGFAIGLTTAVAFYPILMR